MIEEWNMAPTETEIKLLLEKDLPIYGKSGIGKTNIVQQYLEDKFKTNKTYEEGKHSYSQQWDTEYLIVKYKYLIPQIEEHIKLLQEDGLNLKEIDACLLMILDYIDNKRGE